MDIYVYLYYISCDTVAVEQLPGVEFAQIVSPLRKGDLSFSMRKNTIKNNKGTEIKYLFTNYTII